MTDKNGPLWRVIWTRDTGDPEADRTFLATLPPTEPAVAVLHLPCIVTEAVKPVWRADAFDHVVFSSSKAVHYALAEPRFKQLLVRLPGHAFGGQTAAAMQAAGMAVQVHNAKSSEQLATQLVKQLPAGTRVALPGPEEPAFDLAGKLNTEGLRAEAIVCYRTTPTLLGSDGTALSDAEKTRLAASLAGVVCFLSPSAVRGFVEGFGGAMKQLRTRLKAVVIGGTTAGAATPHFAEVLLAPKQTAEAVMDTARTLAASLIQASSKGRHAQPSDRTP